MSPFSHCAVVGAALLAAACGCDATKIGSARPSEPAAISSSGLVDLDGRPVKLGRDPAPEALVALFTRTDCPISNRYAPEVRRLYERFHPRGVAFYLVYVHPDESAEAIRRHKEEYGYPCPAIRDPGHQFVRRVGAEVTPEAAVFDASGQLRYRGRIDDLYLDFGKARQAATSHDLADAIEATLAGRAVAEPRTKAVGCYISDLR